MGSVNSSFIFKSYKVSNLQLKSPKTLGVLGLPGYIDPSLWHFEFNLSAPAYFSSQKIYICELTCKAVAKVSKDSDEEIVSVVAQVAGSFEVAEKFEEKVEENLVKHQGPALLFPYVRSTITSVLANAGFGSVIFPLMNLYEFSKKQLENVDIQVVE